MFTPAFNAVPNKTLNLLIKLLKNTFMSLADVNKYVLVSPGHASNEYYVRCDRCYMLWYIIFGKMFKCLMDRNVYSIKPQS